MDAKQFEKLLAQVGGLSPDQFKRLVHAYANRGGLDAGRIWNSAVYSVSEQKLAALGINRACPGCGSIAIERNGVNAAGIQRLHCQDCGKNFTHFTGTLLEKSRFPWEVWVAVLRKNYRLSLARVNEFHSDIKLMVEKKMTNVATKYLDTYMGFFTFRRNWTGGART